MGHLNKTFCQKCYHGIVTQTEAAGSDFKERDVLLQVVGGEKKTLSTHWEDHPPFSNIESLVLGYDWNLGGQKGIEGIVKFFRSKVTKTIPDKMVWFFDDRANIVHAMKGLPFNAIEV